MFQKPLSSKAYLALLQPRHAQEMSALINCNRSYLRQWLPWVDATRTVFDSKTWIHGALKQFIDNRELHAGLWFEESLAGVIGSRFYWQNHSAVIGYWLGAEYQGKGLMTLACQAFLEHCFISLGLNRVEIRCAAQNVRSQAIPERLGFREEGLLREAEWLYDHYVDHVVYGLLAKEWEQGICPGTKPI